MPGMNCLLRAGQSLCLPGMRSLFRSRGATQRRRWSRDSTGKASLGAMVLLLAAPVFGGCPSRAPALASLQRPEVTFSHGEMLVLGTTGSAEAPTWHLRTPHGIDLGHPHAMGRVLDMELTRSLSDAPVLLWTTVEGDGAQLLKTATYDAASGWTVPRTLSAGRRLSLTEQRPPEDQRLVLRQRVLLAEAVGGRPAPLVLHMTSHGWVVDGAPRSVPPEWILTAVAGDPSWYVGAGWNSATRNASVAVFRAGSSPQVLWEGYPAHHVHHLLTAQFGAVRWIVAAVMLGERTTRIHVWRSADGGRRWTDEGTHRVSGQVQRMHLFDHNADGCSLAVEVADFAKRQLSTITLRGNAAMRTVVVTAFEPNVASLRLVRTADSILYRVAVHHATQGGRSLTRLDRVTP